MTEAEAADAVARLRAQTTRRRWRRSPLDRYRGELVALRKAGATYRALRRWLAQQRPAVKADATTIRRFLIRIQEDAKPCRE